MKSLSECVEIIISKAFEPRLMVGKSCIFPILELMPFKRKFAKSRLSRQKKALENGPGS